MTYSFSCYFLYTAFGTPCICFAGRHWLIFVWHIQVKVFLYCRGYIFSYDTPWSKGSRKGLRKPVTSWRSVMSLSARLLYTTHNKKDHPKVAKVPVTDARIRLSTSDYIAVGRLLKLLYHR